MATEQPPDELDRRIRALEAERLRLTPDRPRPALELAADALLRRLKATYEPEACVDKHEAALSTGVSAKSAKSPQVANRKKRVVLPTNPQADTPNMEASETPSGGV